MYYIYCIEIEDTKSDHRIGWIDRFNDNVNNPPTTIFSHLVSTPVLAQCPPSTRYSFAKRVWKGSILEIQSLGKEVCWEKNSSFLFLSFRNKYKEKKKKITRNVHFVGTVQDWPLRFLCKEGGNRRDRLVKPAKPSRDANLFIHVSLIILLVSGRLAYFRRLSRRK